MTLSQKRHAVLEIIPRKKEFLISQELLNASNRADAALSG